MLVVISSLERISNLFSVYFSPVFLSQLYCIV